MRDPRFKKRSLICVFEGSDAAGKGGAIRRITAALDARQYQIVPIAAPTEEERAQPYLWRFWRHLPRAGRVTIFDRSWYGRVLVERVEGFCAEADWLRAYSEINDFEHELVDARRDRRQVLAAISQDEQLHRFKEREKIEFKRFKITDEDWRNREKWDAYEQAVCDMVDRTSTGHRAVDAGRGERQELRPGQDFAHPLRTARSRAQGNHAADNPGKEWQERQAMSEAEDSTLSDARLVAWVRQAAPYIHAFRGRTFVIAFGGEALLDRARALALIHDIALLDSMGIRLVLVHGARPQIDAEMAARGLEPRFHKGLRVTDARRARVRQARDGRHAHRDRGDALAGLPNTPLAGAFLRVTGGNFISAKPVGVVDGVDFQYTGAVRKVIAEEIKADLAQENVVLITPIGASPTGEIFNLAWEEVAEAVAIAIEADKLIFLCDAPGLVDRKGN